MALTQTPVCDFGQPLQSFTLLDPSGKAYRSADLIGGNGLLIAFICNHCPYVISIADRLSADLNALSDLGIGVAAIMPNDYAAYPADAPSNMALFAKKHGFNFPYLIDENQEVAKSLGAVCTPDFFGYNGSGLLQYRGRLDDARTSEPDARKAELCDAMRLVAQTGRGPAEQTASMGCSIKWR